MTVFQFSSVTQKTSLRVDVDLIDMGSGSGELIIDMGSGSGELIPQFFIREGWLKGVEQTQVLDILNLVLNVIAIILIVFCYGVKYTKKCRGQIASRTKLSNGQTYDKSAQLYISDADKLHEMKPLRVK